jgi:hypothetical protein
MKRQKNNRRLRNKVPATFFNPRCVEKIRFKKPALSVLTITHIFNEVWVFLLVRFVHFAIVAAFTENSRILRSPSARAEVFGKGMYRPSFKHVSP